MVQLERILILGGGIGGMSCAIALARTGYKVELVEADQNWGEFGAGLTLMGPALRALHELGVWPQVREAGFFSSGSRILDYRGRLLMERAGIPIPNLDLPTGGGILRPVLHDILAAKVRELEVAVRVGLSGTFLSQTANGVRVSFSDGSESAYDFVVAADGIHSQMRQGLIRDAHGPQFIGQGCWRMLTKRPTEVDRSSFFCGAPVTIGAVPVSITHMYLWVLQHVPDNPWIDPADQHRVLRELLADFGGAINAVRESIGPESAIVYRPLEAFLLPDPWYRGRVLLLGDAAHATTPHLASGAGMAMEDGLVLAQVLRASSAIDYALQAYMQRRFERCKLVVENSVAIGRAEMNEEPASTLNAIMERSHRALIEPY